MEDTIDNELFKNILKRKSKKISLNIDVKTLGRIDEIAKIMRINRTVIIEGILLANLKSYLKYLIDKFDQKDLKGLKTLSEEEIKVFNQMGKRLKSLDKDF